MYIGNRPFGYFVMRSRCGDLSWQQFSSTYIILSFTRGNKWPLAHVAIKQILPLVFTVATFVWFIVCKNVLDKNITEILMTLNSNQSINPVWKNCHSLLYTQWYFQDECIYKWYANTICIYRNTYIFIFQSNACI